MMKKVNLSLFFEKRSFLLIVVFFPLLLVACSDRTEINNLAIVTTTALDKGEDGQLELSIEIVIPKAIGATSDQGNNSSTGGSTMVISRQGKNLADALAKLQVDVSRKIFFGACKVYIFGEELAKDGIEDYVDFLVRDPRPRERAFVYVEEGPAISHLTPVAVLERDSSETIRKISSSIPGMSLTLKDLDEMMTSEDQGLIIPYLTVKKEQTSQEQLSDLPAIDSFVLFKKDKMVGMLTKEAMTGLLWLKRDVEVATIAVKFENMEGNLSLNEIVTKLNLTPEISNGEWRIIVKGRVIGVIIENSTMLDLNKPKQLRKV